MKLVYGQKSDWVLPEVSVRFLVVRRKGKGVQNAVFFFLKVCYDFLIQFSI